MSDIVERLRDFRSGHVSQLHLLMNEAASYIELLEAHSRSSASALAVIDSGLRNAVAEIERLRLTEAERGAIERACRVIASTLPYESQQGAEDYQTLRGLLERL